MNDLSRIVLLMRQQRSQPPTYSPPTDSKSCWIGNFLFPRVLFGEGGWFCTTTAEKSFLSQQVDTEAVEVNLKGKFFFCLTLSREGVTFTTPNNTIRRDTDTTWKDTTNSQSISISVSINEIQIQIKRGKQSEFRIYYEKLIRRLIPQTHISQTLSGLTKEQFSAKVRGNRGEKTSMMINKLQFTLM